MPQAIIRKTGDLEATLYASLNAGWSFTQVGGGKGTKDGEWIECENFPTTVHVELLAKKRIPDPVRTFL